MVKIQKVSLKTKKQEIMDIDEKVIGIKSPEKIIEEKWEEIREKRNKLLSKSDWMVGNDSPLSETQKQNIIKIRKELRDIPQNYSNPNSVIFPNINIY